MHYQVYSISSLVKSDSKTKFSSKVYQEKINEKCGENKPDIICMLTGKGPLKEYYQSLFKKQNYKNIQVYFLWLEPDDYPILLGNV